MNTLVYAFLHCSPPPNIKKTIPTSYPISSPIPRLTLLCYLTAFEDSVRVVFTWLPSGSMILAGCENVRTEGQNNKQDGGQALSELLATRRRPGLTTWSLDFFLALPCLLVVVYIYMLSVVHESQVSPFKPLRPELRCPLASRRMLRTPGWVRCSPSE